MDAFRKLRDQVSRQQQAVLKQFVGGAFGSSENSSLDESELRQQHKLEKLYTSTRSCKHFQRDVVRGLEGYIVTGSKQVEIGNKLAEDSRKYSAERTCTSSNLLAKAAFSFSKARTQMVKEQDHLLRVYGTQVAEPLRALVLGAPLEDARHLAQRYARMRQEADTQAIEVIKRRAKSREVPGNIDNTSKLEAAEMRLEDLKSNMKVLGKEAVEAMLAVEVQQQRQTLQRLVAMVEAERTYHQRIVQLLEQLEGEIVFESQRVQASPRPASPSSISPAPVIENYMPPPPSYEEANVIYSSSSIDGTSDSVGYFLGEVMHSFQAKSDVELSLSTGDYVVVRKVSGTGWAEGECRRKAGWFPVGHIERRERGLASKILKV